jgi:hypothetical protein
MSTTERLKIEIELKRAALAEIRKELAGLHQELDGFAAQYNRQVGTLEAQLDDVREQIENLQRTKPAVHISMDFDGLWGPGYESVESQYRRAMDPNAAPPPKLNIDKPSDNSSSSTSRKGGDSLRTLYRLLARKFHPDTTTDPAEKARLTVIMAQINAAYRAKNLEELRQLADQKPDPATQKPDPVASAPKVEQKTEGFIELNELSHKLDEEIAWAKSEQIRLTASPLMALKIEYSLARSRGRDLLREIADKVRADLASAMAELDALRRV